MTSMKFFFALPILLGSWIIGGCASYVSVRPVKQGKPVKGLQYSLPQVFVKMEQKADGTMAVTPTTVPDPNHTYAIHSGTFGGSHETTVDLNEKGLLTKLQWKGDSTAVAKGVVDAGSAMAGALLTAHNSKLEKDNEHAEEAKKTAESKVKTAESSVESLTKSIRAKEQEIELKQNELMQLGNLTPQQQLQVELKEQELQKKRRELDAEIDQAKKRTIQDEINKFEAELTALRLPNESLRRTSELELKKLKLELAALQQDLQAARNALADARQELVDANAGVKKLDGSLLDDPGTSHAVGKAFGPVLYRLVEVAYVAETAPIDQPARLSAADLFPSIELRAVPYVNYRSAEAISEQPKFETVAPTKKATETAEVNFTLGANSTLYFPKHHPQFVEANSKVAAAEIALKYANGEKEKQSAQATLETLQHNAKLTMESGAVQSQQIEATADLPLKNKEILYTQQLKVLDDKNEPNNEEVRLMVPAIIKDQTNVLLTFSGETIVNSITNAKPGVYQIYIGVRSSGKSAKFHKLQIRVL